MNRKSHIYRTVLAVFFLALFTNAIAKNIICGLEHLPIFSHQHGNVKHAHPEHDKAHHHSKPKEHHSTKSEHDHKHKNEKCCSELTSIFNSSLIKSKINKPEFKLNLTAHFFDYNPLFNLPFVCFKAVDYFSWRTPPPKIPDIRVFLHSFLI